MRILVIDDDTGMTDLLTILLTPTGTEVISTNSPQEGVRLVHERQPNVVVIDLMLPDNIGFEICKTIRENSDVPILALSAVDTPGMIAQALDKGADDYLTKPVSSATLIARLNKLVRRPHLVKKSLSLAETGPLH
jgi:DNA-binding response OmpR family regulator